MKCVICGRGHKNEGVYCRGCSIELERARAEKRKRNRKRQAVKVLAYKGHVVGLFRKDGKLVPRYIGMSLSGVAKRKLINLDEYCEGYTRDQIKNFKRTVLKCAGA